MKVDTGLGPRYPDLAVYNPGTNDIIGYIEVKSGNAVYSAIQRAKDALIFSRTGIPTYLVRV
jgi:hypothetical protein